MTFFCFCISSVEVERCIVGLEQGVDERSDRCSLCQHQQTAEQHDHSEDRNEPEFLPHSKKGPELAKKGHQLLGARIFMISGWGYGIAYDPIAGRYPIKTTKTMKGCIFFACAYQ
jgi:hypothetical protein